MTNWLDLLVIVIVVLGALAGIRRGFLRGLLDLVTIAVSLIVAALGYHVVASYINHFVDGHHILINVVAFVLVGLVAQSLLSFLVIVPLSPLIRVARATPVSRELDAVIGLFPGAVKGVVLAATLVLLLALTPYGSQFDGSLTRSVLARKLLSGTTALTYRAQDRGGLNLSDFMVVTSPADGEVQRLPFTVTSGLTVSPSDEQQMLDLVNQERQRHGLAALTLDPRLQAVARAHSEEMLRLGYFAHVSPDGDSPAQRIATAGIPYRVAGENIAYAPTTEIAHRSLMRSEGHRANILAPDFSRIGIGIVVTPFGTRMFTQDFTGS